MSANLRGLEKQIGEIEAVTLKAGGGGDDFEGYGDGPCEACGIRSAFNARFAELDRSLGLSAPEGSPTVRWRCDFCGAALLMRADRLTERERELFEREDDMYWLGVICLPEYKEIAPTVTAALRRSVAERYGPHLAAYEALAAELRAAIAALKHAGQPFVCRVPGCRCGYPKTLEVWRRNAVASGYTLTQ